MKLKKKDVIKVSVIIVCMNNLKNLYPCLESIKTHTYLSYEALVVAYLFSKENLHKLKIDYPWISIIESNEIRGFAENNNLALRQSTGKYCFVLNDDTIITTPVIDQLVNSIEQTPNAAIMSPKTLFSNGKIQSCGRPKMNWKTFILYDLKIYKEQVRHSPYINQKGVFQSYNIVGAAFLIKTDIFRELGWFDERYFFCPEDIALSTLANKRGYKVFVDDDVYLYHLEGGTASLIKVATMPAGVKGSLIFFSDNSDFKYFYLSLYVIIISLVRILYWGFRKCNASEIATILFQANINILKSVFTSKSPKEIFINYYSKIKR